MSTDASAWWNGLNAKGQSAVYENRYFTEQPDEYRVHDEYNNELLATTLERDEAEEIARNHWRTTNRNAVVFHWRENGNHGGTVFVARSNTYNPALYVEERI